MATAPDAGESELATIAAGPTQERLDGFSSYLRDGDATSPGFTLQAGGQLIR